MTDLLKVTYTDLTSILTYFDTAIAFWRYSSTYSKNTLANYIS